MKKTLLRGARVVTMADGRADVEALDVLIQGDRIAKVAPHITDFEAEIVDLPERIIMPGLVNAHLHTWQSAMRFVGADWTAKQYSLFIKGIAPLCAPEDVHVGTLAGALSQISTGTTTIANWSNHDIAPEHTDAEVDALAATGIRATFLLDVPQNRTNARQRMKTIDRLLISALSNNSLLRPGLAIRDLEGSMPHVATADIQAANERRLVVSVHQSRCGTEPGWERLRRANVLSSRTNIVHGAGLKDEMIKALVESQVSFTATPESGPGQSVGIPIIGRLLRLGAAPALGTDSDGVAPGSVLHATRIALAQQRGVEYQERARSGRQRFGPQPITGKQALSWATREGAKALGLADRVGRIEQGLQADLIVIDTRALNLWPAHDAVAAALHADASNIEAVLIAGQWRKRAHDLIHPRLAEVRERLARSNLRLFSASAHSSV